VVSASATATVKPTTTAATVTSTVLRESGLGRKRQRDRRDRYKQDS
jgi:hypothetical protein